MKVRQLAANALLVLFSLAVGLVLCEVGSRLLFNPADYLSATMLSDQILGIRIAPGSAGFDDWGFRNAAVPENVDVVAIGDSHTFGNTARMMDAWPQVVARHTGLSVYNLGVGGYGPNQYYQLLTTRGLSLRPKQVVVGLYMGDDFENAFSITYGLEHWAYLRADRRRTVNADIWGDSEPPGQFKSVRNWFSRNSVIYRLLVHGPVLGAIKGTLQFNLAEGQSDPSVTSYQDPNGRIREAFRPLRVAAGLDQGRSEVQEGMRITFHLLNEMNRACREKGCSLSVVIIPTKETVFAEYLLPAQELHLKDTIKSLIANERVARGKLVAFLDEAEIPYVDALPSLRKTVGDELYYRGPADMHPSKNGYKVIGDVVAGLLEQPSSDAR